MNRSWPPNPRDAKHRHDHGSKSWNMIPVTILLIAFSLLTAFFTRVGEDSERADVLFFRSQTERRELAIEWDALQEEWQEQSEANDAGEEMIARVVQIQARLQQIDQEIRKIDSRSDALADVRKGQVWRLFTPMFLHFGYMHIIFNMYWLWMLGALLEIRYRPGRYLLLVLGIAILSNLAQALMKGTNFGGMSGVNYGLFGFLFLHGRFHPTPSFQLDRRTIVYMLVWMVLCFTGVFGTIANWAHSVGFLTGAAVGFSNAMLAGGAKLIKRRSEFKQAIHSTRSDALHCCSVCGTTERKNPDAEFRVGSDGAEYCGKHLPPEDSL